jgi:hypothetical protein
VPPDEEPPPPNNPPGDTVAPTFTTVSPRAGQTGVARGTNVTVQFSEAVRNVTGTTMRLARVNNSGTVLSNVSAPVRYNATSNRGVLDPTNRLAANARYRVTLTSGIRDAAGNALVQRSYFFRTRG